MELSENCNNANFGTTCLRLTLAESPETEQICKVNSLARDVFNIPPTYLIFYYYKWSCLTDINYIINDITFEVITCYIIKMALVS